MPIRAAWRPRCENFAMSRYPNKMVILGDMLELGDSSEEEHHSLVKLPQKLGFARVILVGPVLQKVAPEYGCLSFKNSIEAAEYLHRLVPKVTPSL